MPLIIISGLPASGKSTRARQLCEHFEQQPGRTVHIVAENEAIPRAGFAKNDYFGSSLKEKVVRADLKSSALRLLSQPDALVILDGGNYIKGYRYELYCASKTARTTQCTVYCGIPRDRARAFNAERTAEDVVDAVRLDNGNVAYSDETFDALCLRFEEPHGNNRWDAPLFTVLPDDRLDVEGINGALFESKPPPPNKSTQSAPLSSTTYLFELDRITQAIVAACVAARKLGSVADVPVPATATGGTSGLVCCVPADITAAQLNRLRRQFLNYNRVQLGGGTDLAAVGPLFVQFLNSTFNK